MRPKLTYANVMSTLCLFLLLGGGAYAATKLPKNSVGTRQLQNNAVIGSKVKDGSLTGADLKVSTLGTLPIKHNAVTTGKIADNAVNGAKVANGSLTGADIDLAVLGKVPAAREADHAAGADALLSGQERHQAACPASATLIRGICFDSSSNPAVANVRLAADACAARGGYLPTPLELYSTRTVLNLGTGIGSDHQYTDSYYANSGAYSTIVVDGNAALTEQPVDTASRYICAYPLVR